MQLPENVFVLDEKHTLSTNIILKNLHFRL